jgi:hypothetical protein
VVLINEFVILVSFVFRTRYGGKHGHALVFELDFFCVVNFELALLSELFEINLIRKGFEASGPSVPPVSF